MPLQTNLSCSDSNLRKAKFNEGSRLQKNIYLKKKKGSLGMEAMFADRQVATAVAWVLLVCEAAPLGW